MRFGLRQFDHSEDGIREWSVGTKLEVQGTWQYGYTTQDGK